MYKINTIACITFICLFSSSQAIPVLKVGIVDTNPPFISIKNGAYQGFEIELAQLFCNKMNVKCNYIAYPFSELISALVDKKIDFIMGSMVASNDRKKQINFSTKYYINPARFVASKTSSLSTTDQLDFKGKTIAAMTGTAQENFINFNFSKIANVRSYANTEEGIKLLTTGAVDAIFDLEFRIVYNLLEKPIGKDYLLIGQRYTAETWFGEGISVGIRKSDLELLDAINQAIEQSRKDNSYQTINAKYFDFDIFKLK